MTDAEYNTFKKNFQGKWVWKEDINLKAVYEESGMPKEMIDFELASQPCVTMEVRKQEGNGPYKIFTDAVMRCGDQTSTYKETMAIGEPREVSDEEQTMCSKVCITMDGELTKDVIQPVKPPGKEYTVVTERIGDEMHSGFQCGDVTGKRVFKLEAAN